MPNTRHNSTAGTFEFIEQQIRHDAVGTGFGADFEWLCRHFLLAAPQYQGLLE